MTKVHSIQLSTSRIYLREACEIHQNQGVIQKIIMSRCKRVPMALHSAFFIRQVSRKKKLRRDVQKTCILQDTLWKVVCFRITSGAMTKSPGEKQLSEKGLVLAPKSRAQSFTQENLSSMKLRWLITQYLHQEKKYMYTYILPIERHCLQ